MITHFGNRIRNETSIFFTALRHITRKPRPTERPEGSTRPCKTWPRPWGSRLKTAKSIESSSGSRRRSTVRTAPPRQQQPRTVQPRHQRRPKRRHVLPRLTCLRWNRRLSKNSERKIFRKLIRQAVSIRRDRVVAQKILTMNICRHRWSFRDSVVWCDHGTYYQSPIVIRYHRSH